MNTLKQLQSPAMRARISLLDLSIWDAPFQLLPGAVYAPHLLEKSLVWQREFAAANAARLPRFAIGVEGEVTTASRLVESLASQSYQNFELVFFNDTSLDSSLPLLQLLTPMANHTVLRRQTSQYEALCERSSADYFILLHCNNLLHPSALFCLAKYVAANLTATDARALASQGPDLLYANEVLFRGDSSLTGESYFRKSEPAKYSLLTSNTLGQPLVVHRNLVEKLRSDSLLQTIDSSDTVPPVSRSELHAWRTASHAVAVGAKIDFLPLGLFCSIRDLEPGAAKPASPKLPTPKLLELQEAVVQAFGASIGAPLTAQQNRDLGCPELKAEGGAVQIVIPFKNGSALTIRCLESIARQGCAADLRITLIDNGSEKNERDLVRNFIGHYPLSAQTELMLEPGNFNFARLNNLAVTAMSAAGEDSFPYILFLNNDVELSGPTCIEELRNWCGLPDVGLVGGSLFFPDGSLQHAGISFATIRPKNVRDQSEFCHLLREVDSVSFAMAMVKAELFRQLKGLDEFLCPNGFGDALFGARVRQRGYRVIHNPAAKATHHESVSRGIAPEELEYFELSNAGVEIPELYDDFRNINRPTRIALGRLQPSATRKLIRGAAKICLDLPPLNRAAKALIRLVRATNRRSAG